MFIMYVISYNMESTPPPTDSQVDKYSIHTVEYYPVLKKES